MTTQPNITGTFRRMGTIRAIERAEGETEDSRRVEIAVSSELPVVRYFGNEVLRHDAESVIMDFIGGGRAPLLLDHNHSKQIGVIESARLDDDKVLRAVVRFSRSAMAEEIYRDVLDGIRQNISVGYEIRKYAIDEKSNTVTATAWYPFEASSVSVPADSTVGVGREGGEIHAPAIIERNSDMPDPVTPTPPENGQWTESQLREQVRNAQQEAAEIAALGARYNMQTEAAEAVRTGTGLSAFRGIVLEARQNAPLQSSDIGLTDRETRQFSIMRLAAAAAPGAGRDAREAAAFEIEATQAAADLASTRGYQARGSILPGEVLRDWINPTRLGFQYAQNSRVINIANDVALLPEDFRPGSFIDVLRNASSVMQAGATTLSGLQGVVDIPRKTAASVASWVQTEGGNAVESEPTFGSLAMTPRDLAVYTDITRRARQNLIPDIEALIRRDITEAIALGLDLAALEGTGLLGQPTGVRNVVGINKPAAFAGANPTFAEVVALETMVADDNALLGNLAYILRTNMAGALKTTEKFAGTGFTVWEEGNRLNGYPAIRSNQGTDGNLYFGNWSDVLVGTWSTLDIQFDYSALALSGGLRIIAFQTADIAVRRPESFAWNT